LPLVACRLPLAACHLSLVTCGFFGCNLVHIYARTHTIVVGDWRGDVAGLWRLSYRVALTHLARAWGGGVNHIAWL
jgi:hypothetical protein